MRDFLSDKVLMALFKTDHWEQVQNERDLPRVKREIMMRMEIPLKTVDLLKFEGAK